MADASSAWPVLGDDRLTEIEQTISAAGPDMRAMQQAAIDLFREVKRLRAAPQAPGVRVPVSLLQRWLNIPEISEVDPEDVDEDTRALESETRRIVANHPAGGA